MKNPFLVLVLGVAVMGFAQNPSSTNVQDVVDLGQVVVEGTALSRYRPEKVDGATFTDVPPEELPTVVETLTEDFIREHNPTDLHDLMRYVSGIETGGKSLLIRQPGTFAIRGMGGSEPTFDGVMPIGRGAGLFIDPFLLDRVEIVKGPIGSLSGGSGATQNASGAGGSVNMHLKSATLAKDEVQVQENTSVGKHTFRQRGMVDANETALEDKAAVRVVATADYYEPTYVNEGVQKGARPRESFTVSPSFIAKPTDEVSFGLKTLFQYTDQPGYIGVPVWRGRPAAGYGWYESSCRRGDRATYESFMLNPWADWQVTDAWLLKFGAGLMVSDWDFTMQEPYTGSGAELQEFYETGHWTSGNRYMTSSFSEGSSLNRNYNLFTRSVYTKEVFEVVTNAFVVQPDYVYRESTGGFGTPTSRYGLLAQDAISWRWFTVLGGVRYDHFEQEAYTDSGVRYFHQTADAVSPRGGLTIRPVDYLVFFGNISQTRTPMLGLRNADGSTPTTPWRATQYEGGVRVRPGDKLWFTLSTYRIEQENVPEADAATGYYTYDGRNTSRGAELSVSGDVTDNWTILGMYGFNSYTDRNVAPGEKGRDFERYPAHTLSLNTSYRLTWGSLEDVVVGCGYRFRSMNYATMRGSYVNKNLRFDPSHLFDVNVSMPLSKFGGGENWILTFGVRNLFGEKYFESSRHYYECLVGEPRTFEIGLRATF
ncbi:MAG: TonB-dependent receptor [bacterium]|nr:TonB-dependent receptor [bacterium]